MFSKFPMFALAVFLAYGVAQIVAAYVGIEHHWGGVAAGLLIGVSFLFRFTLPITIGSFFGAMDVWGWHWAVAAIFAVPGLLLLAPGAIMSLLIAAKQAFGSSPGHFAEPSEVIIPEPISVTEKPPRNQTLVWILALAVVGLLGVILGMVIGDRKSVHYEAQQPLSVPADVVQSPIRPSFNSDLEQVSQTPTEEAVVNIYNWSDYIEPATLEQFTKETGIKVNYDVFDSNEVLETKLLAGTTGYDVVVPGAYFIERQVKAGMFMKLDRAKLSNWVNLDQALLGLVESHDPSNEHGVIHMWGTDGIGYNEGKIKAIDPNAPVDSWSLVFDPTWAAKFKDCGISVLDAPSEIVGIALAYLGKDPNSQNEADLKAAEGLLLKVRPYIRMIHSSNYIEALANGELCIAVGWSGDVLQARDRAAEAGQGNVIKYTIPKEGTIIWFDMYAIPADAKHPDNAHTFINFMMRPEIAAANSNFINYANGNAASLSLVSESVRNDPGIHLSPELKAKMFPDLAETPEFTRLLNRTWTRFIVEPAMGSDIRGQVADGSLQSVSPSASTGSLKSCVSSRSSISDSGRYSNVVFTNRCTEPVDVYLNLVTIEADEFVLCCGLAVGKSATYSIPVGQTLHDVVVCPWTNKRFDRASRRCATDPIAE
jgi:putrescine transport system substrate-binding protein